MRNATHISEGIRRGAIGVAFLALAGCGSTNSTPPERPSGAIQGTVFAAPVSGATVKAYAYHDGRKGELLGEALTDAGGRYAIDVKTQDGAVLLEASGGAYREEASGRDVTLSPQPLLRSLVRYANRGPAAVSSITSFTTLATGLAEHLVSNGSTAQAAMDQAFATFDDALGLDVRAVTPLDITDVANATGGLTPGHEYGFYEAAISQWTAEAGTRNGVAPHSAHTSATFVALGYDDIRADGELNGRAGETELRVGSVPLTTEVYRLELALALLRIAQGSANRTGLSAERVLPAANRWNESTAAMFGDTDVTPLNQTGPTMSALRPLADSTLRGVVSARVVADDPIGVTEVLFLLDGLSLGAAADPGDARLEIDTRAHPDGSHQLQAQARNIAGGTGTLEHTVIFDNTPPSIDGFSEATVTWCGVHRASATVSDAAVSESVFLLDGQPRANQGTASAPHIEVDSRSEPIHGEHTLTLRVTDAAGNVSSRSRILHIPEFVPLC